MDMISVSKLALKNAFMVNVAKDQIINVFVIWDTLGLIVIQIVDVMGTPVVIIWDQVVVMTANIILKENSATCVPKAVLATLLPLKVMMAFGLLCYNIWVRVCQCSKFFRKKCKFCGSTSKQIDFFLSVDFSYCSKCVQIVHTYVHL